MQCMDSDWLLVGATGWLSYRRDAARLSSVSGGGGAEEGAEPRAVPDLEPAGHGKPEACETRRRGRVKHELKISQTGEWMKGGGQPFEQWDPEWKTSMWQDNWVQFRTCWVWRPNSSWRHPEEMKPKTGERDETKPREGIKSENWSKENQRMKGL